MLHVHRVVVEFYFVKRERFRANVGALQERVRHTVVHALLGHTLAAWDRVFAVVVVALEAIRAMAIFVAVALAVFERQFRVVRAVAVIHQRLLLLVLVPPAQALAATLRRARPGRTSR